MNSAYKSIENLNYVKATDSSSSYTSPTLDLKGILSGVAYQVVWDTGVTGTFTWEATIFDDQWETLVDCEEVTVDADGSAGSSIVALPRVWLLARLVRFRWTPNNSTGNFKAGLRVLPI